VKRALLLPAVFLMLAAAGDPARETEHVVQAGETLNGIANRAGVPAIVIAEANGLAEPYAVRGGQKLVIPRQRRHTVRPGETGHGIANRYGVAFADIAVANGLDDKGTVRTSQVLIIPAVIRAAAQAAPVRRAEPYFRWPHDGRIVRGYALREDGGGHDGMDFAARAGDMVRASASGTVTFAGPVAGRFGRMVVIDHGNGWETAYGHIDRVTVKAGDVVKSGERVGTAARAGESVDAEVHFELRQNGRKIDPADRMPPRR